MQQRRLAASPLDTSPCLRPHLLSLLAASSLAALAVARSQKVPPASPDPSPAVAAPTVAAAPNTTPPSALTVPLADFPKFDAGTSLLVVAPHPDDETLCCAGVIQRVIAAGGKVGVVWITSGDASEMDLLVIEKSLFRKPQKLRDLAARRMQEARAAADILGIPADRQMFLGYPDRGVLSLLTDHYVTPLYSKFNGSSVVPYENALSPGQPYTGRSLERDFDNVLQRLRPTLVLAPSPRDAHSDHEAAGVLAMRAMSQRGELAELRYWIVHGGEPWPLPRGYHPTRREYPSPRGKGLAARAFELTPQEEQRKLQALQCYQTQMRVMSSYLLAYVRITELYSDTPMPPPGPGQELPAQPSAAQAYPAAAK
jgi:LmbE family N-acetylglucosaminyl deacetylase